MVKTRSGNDVSYTEASYGRAARKETTRKRQRMKLIGSTSERVDDHDRSPSTPRRTRNTRAAQMQQEEDLATPPSALNRVGITPPKKTERLLRGRRPTCSDYGIARHFSFQGNGFFFCHACDIWDSLPPDRSRNASRVSARFACTAHHESFSHPTMLCKDFCKRGPAMQVRRGFDTTNQDSDHSSACSSSSMTTDGQEEQGGLGAENYDDISSPLDEADEANYPEQYQGDIQQALDTNHCNRSCNGVDNQPAEPAVRTNIVSPTNASRPAARNCPLQEDNNDLITIRELKSKIQVLRRWNLKLAREIARTRDEAKKKSTVSENGAYQGELLDAINSVTLRHNRHCNSSCTSALVAKALWNHEVFHTHFLKLGRKYFRDTVFTPYNILREMDLAGGTLSYEGIDVIRRVETRGLKRFRGSIIPSKSEIKRMAGIVEWFASQLCPFQLKQTTKGESIEFDYAKAMLCITKAFYLDGIGKTRSLSVASSIDGASLSKNLSIIAGGVKITDHAARCPLTKRPLLDNPATMCAQSRNLCLPLKIMMGRETKETFTEFGPLFKFLDDLSDATTMPNEMQGFCPFVCMTNCDLSAQWKGLCKGGAAKVHTLPCTGCATESNSLATPNDRVCARWCFEHSKDPDWMCFHKPMATPERVLSMKSEVQDFLTTMEGALEEVQAESKMNRSDVELDIPSESSRCDPLSIHFCPTNATQRQSFSGLITNELILRGLDINGTLETRREKLWPALKGESTINRLSKEIAHGEVREGAYFLLMQTLPCVLHMENRNGIKLLTMVFIEGLSNVKKKLLYTDINAEGTRVLQYISDLEQIINRSILGTDDDPCQWMCPYDPKKKELGPITMDNVRTRRIIDSLDTIVDLCVIDEGRKTMWTSALNNYRIAMVLLRKREDFTNTAIATYQHHADKFFQSWILLWQKEGITNYIHMIGSGHVADYLYKWRNLYRFSQQGWEAMNSLIKTFFFRRTSHGGGVKGASKKSRLIPIARWLQRRLIFLCRINEDDIRNYVKDHPMPPNYRTQAASEDDVYDW